MKQQELRGIGEGGFSMIEMLVAIAIFSIISTVFFTAMFSATRGSNEARSVVRISEEARLGLNRMVRDTREADEIKFASDNQFRVLVNFNNDFADLDGDPLTPEEPVYTNTPGNIEDITFTYDPARQQIFLNGELLVRGISPLPGAPPNQVFRFYSSLLEFDWNGDGVVTALEVDDAQSHGVGCVGDRSGSVTPPEFPFLSRVEFAMQISDQRHTTTFFAQSQLRNFGFQTITC